MLVIRDQQMEALRWEQAEARIAVHLQRIFPEKCAQRGESGVRASIREGRTRAVRYGFTTPPTVRRYIDLMYAIVDDFDTHPEVPGWVGEHLRRTDLPPDEKMDQLWVMAKEELQRRADAQAGQGAGDVGV